MAFFAIRDQIAASVNIINTDDSRSAACSAPSAAYDCFTRADSRSLAPTHGFMKAQVLYDNIQVGDADGSTTQTGTTAVSLPPASTQM